MEEIVKIVNTVYNNLSKKDNYSIDVYNDNLTYYLIDLSTNTVFYRELKTLSCGCCCEYIDGEINFNDINLVSQFEIMLDIYEKQCIC